MLKVLHNCTHVSSVQLLICLWLFATPWTTARQASLSTTDSWSLRKLMSIESVMPSSHLILCHPLLLLPSIFPSIKVFSMSQLFVSGGQSIQHQSFQWIFRVDWLVWSPCCPKDSQESSPALQFKSINSLVLSLLYGPTLASIHDYQKIKYKV